ncbi:MAG: acetoacetate--CoA ligase, partial [Bacteroidota bacterium]
SLSLPLDDGTYSWQDVMLDAESDALLRFTPVAFEHPIWILYSSGTTGKPKAITHSHGGVLLEHLKYLSLQNDVRPGERFFWFTTTGWMMWNFLQASMLVGGVPVLYDGSPGYPNLTKLWSLCEDLGIHHFGTSAPFLIACMNQELAVSDEMDLSTLRTIGSTGAPLPAEAFRWVYQHVKRDVWLCSMSGGTDVCTAFVGSSPSLPVRVGRIQARALGCALEAYGTDQQPVVDELGEMVILQPMPSMPIYFWNDPGGSRFHTSYFDVYPGIWRHGDWIEIASDGSLVIHGRSDATLNRNGIRIGTAEIYSVLDSIDEVSDSLIINVEQPNGGDYMPLFIVMDDTAEMTSDLKKRIKQTLRTQCSPRHIPDDILVCNDIPYTLSGKKMEVPIKRMFMHRDAAPTIQRDAMRNPEAMDWFVSYVGKFYHKG